VKRVLAVSLTLGLGLFATACEIPEEDGGDGGSGRSNAKPDLTVSATSMIKEYEENEAAADKKYQGKVLEVSGVVDKIDTELFDDEKYIIQVGGGGQFELFTVNCPGQSGDAVADIKKGQKITVIGEFDDGGDLGVELTDCRVA